MQEAGLTGAPPPFKLVKSWLSKHYQVPPWYLDDEPADEVFLYYQLEQEYKRWYNMRPDSQKT